MPPRQRIERRAAVTATERLSQDLVRLTFDCPDLAGVELPHTDHYIKFSFPPVTRTYTVRSHDTATGAIVVDFVVHGDEGLAGPWAAAATPGDEISFFGPGGAWHPAEGVDHFVLVGDESAAPAIAAALEALPRGASATVFLEIADDAARFPMPTPTGAVIEWVARDGAAHGSALAARVRAAAVPQGRVHWFVHGVAEMVKDLRALLFVERGVPRADVSISGYWRSGMTEDGWQASKHDFVAAMEAAELAAGAEAPPAK